MYNYAAYGEPYPFSYKNNNLLGAPSTNGMQQYRRGGTPRRRFDEGGLSLGAGQERLRRGLYTPGGPMPQAPAFITPQNPMDSLPFQEGGYDSTYRGRSQTLSQLPFYNSSIPSSSNGSQSQQNSLNQLPFYESEVPTPSSQQNTLAQMPFYGADLPSADSSSNSLQELPFYGNTFARGGLSSIHKAAQMLQRRGRGGDTILAHINPLEAHMLKMMGGSGTINPATGLPEFGFFGDLWDGIKSVAGDVWGGVKDVASNLFSGAKHVVEDGYDEIKHVAPKIIQQIAPMAGEALGGFLGENPMTAMMGGQIGSAIGNAFADSPADQPQQEVYGPSQMAPYQMSQPPIDPEFLQEMQSIYGPGYAAQMMGGARGFARGGLSTIAHRIQSQGRMGDSILAHIQPHHALMLNSMGGSGTINPATGLPEFFFNKIIKEISRPFRGGGGGSGIVGGLLGSTLGLLTGGPLGALAGGALGGSLSNHNNPLQGGILGSLGGLGMSSLLGGGLGNGVKNTLLGGALLGTALGRPEKQDYAGEFNRALQALPQRRELPLIDHQRPHEDSRRPRHTPIPLTEEPPLGEGRFYENPVGYAEGGMLSEDMDMTPGGFLNGSTDGQADKIPALLSDGEFVIPADVVSQLGDGNSAAGSKKLYGLIKNVRKHKATKGFPPRARAVTSYLKDR